LFCVKRIGILCFCNMELFLFAITHHTSATQTSRYLLRPTSISERPNSRRCPFLIQAGQTDISAPSKMSRPIEVAKLETQNTPLSVSVLITFRRGQFSNPDAAPGRPNVGSFTSRAQYTLAQMHRVFVMDNPPVKPTTVFQ